MPFEKREAAELFGVDLQDASQARKLAKFHPTATAFPMADDGFADPELFCDNSLFHANSPPPIADEFRHTESIHFVHWFSPDLRLDCDCTGGSPPADDG
jgi:hypothetical protein